MTTHVARQVIRTFVGANGRALQFVLKSVAADGTVSAYDLTGFTVTLLATYQGSTKINEAACTLTDAAAGEFEYTPSASEIDVAGKYAARIKLVNPSALVDFPEPFWLQVDDPEVP